MINCHDGRNLSPGTTDAVKLGRFFDKVIERRYHRDNSVYGDKWKSTIISPFTSPLAAEFTTSTPQFGVKRNNK